MTSKNSFKPNYRWTVLGIGVAAQASFSVAFSGIPITGVLMRTDYHFTTSQLGLVLGCMALGVAVSEILWGLLTDRFGDRRILLTGLLSTGLMLAWMSFFVAPTKQFIPTVLQLGISLTLVGFLSGSVNSSSGRAVMTWFTDKQRGFAMSIRQTAIPAGGAIGAVLLPWLAANFGFRAVYGVLAFFCMASALATWRWIHTAETKKSSISASTIEMLPSPLVRWDVWRLALASGLLTVPQIAVLTFGAIFLHDAKQVSLAAISITIMIMQIGGAVLRIWSGRYTDKYGNRRKMIKIIGSVAGLLGISIMLLSDRSATLITILICLCGLFANAWHGIAYTEIASMSGASRAGTALGMEGTTIFTTAFITPFLIPFLLIGSSWSSVWGAVALCSLLAVPLSPGKVYPASRKVEIIDPKKVLD